MASKTPFAERAEGVLMASILVGIVLVAQQYSLQLYRFGLCLLVAATLLQIAVGNIPKHLGAAASLVRIVVILCVVALMFLLGILLVPYFAQLGR
ncbi:hypothetical protein [Kumtagia ephedrae]|jgi:hypothetical protein|uniref:AI-2E family transporter n=1 Tax=Kumtagia ephedrae TaxID=2116701 RepID=A0A2P7SJF4_9HYPH|nr:hypothetical protein [Mesorhizobium ephedrae]PSJ62629.1 hypothetical protein C7I84_08500 [Mesorhizobium ephedrae]